MHAWLPRLLLPLLTLPACPVLADAPLSANEPQQAPAAVPNGPLAPPSTSARPGDEAIRAAVREVLAEMPESPLPATGTALSGGPYRDFARSFSEAAKPHCMGPNALKHQPSGFSTRNWNFGFGGLAALPFWGAAIARGKCSWNR